MTPNQFDIAIKDIETDLEGDAYTIDIVTTSGTELFEYSYAVLERNGPEGHLLKLTDGEESPVFISTKHIEHMSKS